LGYEVRIFSSDFIKGRDGERIEQKEDKIGKVIIKRFKGTKLGGESFMSWNFEKEALEYKPDLIIAHSYRHLHTTKALKIAKKIGARVFLVTHAPFARNERGLFGKISVWFYDNLIGKYKLNKFDRIIAISKWEYPYLEKLGVQKDRIEYIPNGIPNEFFIPNSIRQEKKILFLGRISPIKNIETLLKAIPLLKDSKIKVELVGPAEAEYLQELKSLIDKLNVKDRVIFSEAIYNTSDKISKIDSAAIFVLPSKSEAMPQSLIEAMVRGKVVIGSDNLGDKDLIEDGKNGYLFKIGDEKDLADKINKILEIGNKTGNAGKRFVEQFRWTKIVDKIDNLIKNSD
jgi:glycosyltransferase involved in cell wall biosynthesis